VVSPVTVSSVTNVSNIDLSGTIVEAVMPPCSPVQSLTVGGVNFQSMNAFPLTYGQGKSNVGDLDSGGDIQLSNPGDPNLANLCDYGNDFFSYNTFYPTFQPNTTYKIQVLGYAADLMDPNHQGSNWQGDGNRACIGVGFNGADLGTYGYLGYESPTSAALITFTVTMGAADGGSDYEVNLDHALASLGAFNGGSTYPEWSAVLVSVPVTTPEPATMSLLVLGGIGALLRRRKA
jgi:hypothetical protein